MEKLRLRELSWPGSGAVVPSVKLTWVGAKGLGRGNWGGRGRIMESKADRDGDWPQQRIERTQV